jgi:GNAT superfamily N-acetyltransferase
MAYERMLKSMRACFRLLARSSEGAHVLELDGVLASVVPAVPERSLPNSVLYESQQSLVAAIPELARHYDDASFTRMLAEHPPGVSRNYVADVDGEPAACLLILPVDGDASVYWVATLPEARGRGLAGRLMQRALWDARENGCDISTLQATKLGEPVYTRLGYESHGALQMWEKRR